MRKDSLNFLYPPQTWRYSIQAALVLALVTLAPTSAYAESPQHRSDVIVSPALPQIEPLTAYDRELKEAVKKATVLRDQLVVFFEQAANGLIASKDEQQRALGYSVKISAMRRGLSPTPLIVPHYDEQTTNCRLEALRLVQVAAGQFVEPLVHLAMVTQLPTVYRAALSACQTAHSVNCKLLSATRFVELDNKNSFAWLLLSVEAITQGNDTLRDHAMAKMLQLSIYDVRELPLRLVFEATELRQPALDIQIAILKELAHMKVHDGPMWEISGRYCNEHIPSRRTICLSFAEYMIRNGRTVVNMNSIQHLITRWGQSTRDSAKLKENQRRLLHRSIDLDNDALNSIDAKRRLKQFLVEQLNTDEVSALRRDLGTGLR